MSGIQEEEPDAGSETEGTADGKKRPCKSPTAANRSKRAKTDAEPEIKEEVRTDETENGVESIIGNDDMKEYVFFKLNCSSGEWGAKLHKVGDGASCMASCQIWQLGQKRNCSLL